MRSFEPLLDGTYSKVEQFSITWSVRRVHVTLRSAVLTPCLGLGVRLDFERRTEMILIENVNKMSIKLVFGY